MPVTDTIRVLPRIVSVTGTEDWGGENMNETKENNEKNGGFNMIKNIRKQLKNEKGLTLVELLAVIVILGIIAAIAVPAIGNIITNSKYNAAKADALNVLNAAQMYYLDNPEGETIATSSDATTTEVTVKGLENAGYLETAGAIPDDAGVSIATPHALTADVEFANGKTVKFVTATIEMINEDSKKGSQITDSSYTIGTE